MKDVEGAFALLDTAAEEVAQFATDMPFTPPTKSPTFEDMIDGATTSRTKEIVGLATDEANKLIDEMMKRPKLKTG